MIVYLRQCVITLIVLTTGASLHGAHVRVAAMHVSGSTNQNVLVKFKCFRLLTLEPTVHVDEGNTKRYIYLHRHRQGYSRFDTWTA